MINIHFRKTSSFLFGFIFSGLIPSYASSLVEGGRTDTQLIYTTSQGQIVSFHERSLSGENKDSLFHCFDLTRQEALQKVYNRAFGKKPSQTLKDILAQAIRFDLETPGKQMAIFGGSVSDPRSDDTIKQYLNYYLTTQDSIGCAVNQIEGENPLKNKHSLLNAIAYTLNKSIVVYAKGDDVRTLHCIHKFNIKHPRAKVLRLLLTSENYTLLETISNSTDQGKAKSIPGPSNLSWTQDDLIPECASPNDGFSLDLNGGEGPSIPLEEEIRISGQPSMEGTSVDDADFSWDLNGGEEPSMEGTSVGDADFSWDLNDGDEEPSIPLEEEIRISGQPSISLEISQSAEISQPLGEHSSLPVPQIDIHQVEVHNFYKEYWELTEMARSMGKNQRNQEAAQLYLEALNLAREKLRNSYLEGRALIGLGNARYTDSTHSSNTDWYKEALRSLGEQGNRFLRAQALIGLGNAKYSGEVSYGKGRGEYLSERNCYEEALKILGEQGDRFLRAQASIGLGNYYYHANREKAQADRYLQQAIRLAPTGSDLHKRAIELHRRLKDDLFSSREPSSSRENQKKRKALGSYDPNSKRQKQQN